MKIPNCPRCGHKATAWSGVKAIIKCNRCESYIETVRGIRVAIGMWKFGGVWGRRYQRQGLLFKE